MNIKEINDPNSDKTSSVNFNNDDNEETIQKTKDLTQKIIRDDMFPFNSYRPIPRDFGLKCPNAPQKRGNPFSTSSDSAEEIEDDLKDYTFIGKPFTYIPPDIAQFFANQT